MSLFNFGKMKNENMNFKAPGWDAITNEAERVYPGQTNPKHYGTIIKWRLGGPDPLDGISIYDGGDYWHFVTYGLSELYEKKSNVKEISGYGMEFTFKLRKSSNDNDELFKMICGAFQNLAKYTFLNGEIFKTNEYIMYQFNNNVYNIGGFITIKDTSFNELNTPNGKVEFVEFIGVTQEEVKKVHAKEISVNELYEKLGTDITEFNRNSVV